MEINESRWQQHIPITQIELIAGLSCSVDEDLNRLRQWASEGWQVVEVRKMCVVLERASPAQMVFAVDYQHCPDAEYFGLCRMAGWTHVVSLSQSIHLFKAPTGTRSLFSAHDASMNVRAQQRLHRAVLLYGLVFVSMVWLISTLVWPWLVMHDDGFITWMFIGCAFVSIYAVMTMFMYTALPWVMYQMRRYGAEVRWSRHRARVFIDGLSVVVGVMCGWVVAY